MQKDQICQVSQRIQKSSLTVLNVAFLSRLSVISDNNTRWRQPEDGASNQPTVKDDLGPSLPVLPFVYQKNLLPFIFLTIANKSKLALGGEQGRAFVDIKEAPCNESVLLSFNFDLPLYIQKN